MLMITRVTPRTCVVSKVLRSTPQHFIAAKPSPCLAAIMVIRSLKYASDYYFNYIISDMARENHLGNMIYIHDLDSYAVGMHNCLSIPFDDLLAKGFNTRQTDVRPANSVNTAFQLVAVIFQLQSLQQFGRLRTAC